MMPASKTSMDPLVLRLKKMAISTRSWLQKMVNQPMNGLGSIPFVTLDQNMCLMISIAVSYTHLTKKNHFCQLGATDILLVMVIDVYIKELRKKLELDCIVTVRNVGYKLERP